MVKRPFAKRGEVWIVNLDPTVGSEIRKARPCLVVSPNSMNRSLSTLTIMPLTSGSKPAAFRVENTFRGKTGFLLADQIRTISRQRLRSYIGEFDRPTLIRALTVLRDMFEE